MITVRKKMMKAYYSEQKMMTSNVHKKNDDKKMYLTLQLFCKDLYNFKVTNN